RPSGHLADEDLGAGRGEAAGGVVLGEPVAPVAETVTQLGQLECLLDGLYWRAALPDRRLIEDGKGEVAHAAASSPFDARPHDSVRRRNHSVRPFSSWSQVNRQCQ